MKRSLRFGVFLLTLGGVAFGATALPRLDLTARLTGFTTSVKTMPTVKRESGPDLAEFAPPRHLLVSFRPERDDGWRELRIYPVSDLLTQYPEKGVGTVRATIDRLRRVLQDRPTSSRVQGEMPFLPPINAGEVLHGGLKYLDFPGVRGVRYLTAYSHEVAPLQRDQVFYTFQGLTNDGRYYLSFVHPYRPKFLPADVMKLSAAEQAEFDRIWKNEKGAWEQYVKRTVSRLDVLDDPSLSQLDAFVRGVRLR